MSKKTMDFIPVLKSGKTDQALVLLVAYGKEFYSENHKSYRFTYSTGCHVDRDGWNPGNPGQEVKALIKKADLAYQSLVDDDTPISAHGLRQRIDLLNKGCQWNGNELFIANGKDIEKYVVPDSISRKELTKAVINERQKKAPNYKKVVHSFISEGANELFGFWEGIISGTITPRHGKKLTPSTISAKRQTFNLLKEYDDTLTFDKMTMQFYNAFTKWMTNKKFDENTTGKHIKELKAILNLAYRNELIANDRFKFWTVVREKNEVVSLTKEEVISFINLPLTGSMADVRDLFVIACFLGHRISDFNQLIPENFITKNGITFHEYVSSKTSVLIRVPVPPQAMEVIHKRWNNWPNMIALPNIRYNLKEISKKAGLDYRVVTKIRNGKPVYKPKWDAITPHSARRTAATSMFYGWFNKPMPASLCMRFTGHKSEKSFLTYIGAEESVLNDKILEYFDLSPLKVAR
jgi:integrase